jgi:hypothetical protein
MNLQKLIIGNHLWFGRDTNDNFIYQVGTVAVTNGSATVNGTGTTFTGTAPGTKLSIGGRTVSVASVTSATVLVLTSVWYGPTGATLPWWKNVANSIDVNTQPATEGAWISVGDIEDANFNPTRDEVEVFSPSPGHYVMSEKLTKFSRLSVEFTLQDMSELFFEMLMSARGPIGSGSSGGPYSPYTATGVIRGWFRCAQFGQDDAQNNIFVAWGRATAQATRFGNDIAKGKISFELLANPLNSGTMSLEA